MAHESKLLSHYLQQSSKLIESVDSFLPIRGTSYLLTVSIPYLTTQIYQTLGQPIFTEMTRIMI
jgi:hypothetical protein